jgi:hypothetical protein
MQRPRRNAQKVARKHGRFLLDLRLVVKTNTARLHGRTKNLNEGGLGATIAGELPMGELVELQFQLIGVDEPMALRAEVRYRQGFQYGFKFFALTEEQLQTIRQTLLSLPLEE